MGAVQEEVDVRPVAQGTGEPSMFVWRGRLFVVRRVVARRSTERSTRAHVVWRVEASAGREHGCATFDLSYGAPVPVGPSGGGWTLLPVGG
ncbi:DUF6504 family protein [Luteipulveratus sp. YIM 133132]|uniref:DUF6504 family protein n=1 Tax=Luteipulveratus flavus TaxID=3031728 RepID=UPI0023AF50EE|nr:DUF6504 family protein [Luteipulveratus sp. YIM 133132]MDE9366776.1 DUF6504 family protein [Luteipulveratus sp. YIM 133132]